MWAPYVSRFFFFTVKRILISVFEIVRSSLMNCWYLCVASPLSCLQACCICHHNIAHSSVLSVFGQVRDCKMYEYHVHWNAVVSRYYRQFSTHDILVKIKHVPVISYNDVNLCTTRIVNSKANELCVQIKWIYAFRTHWCALWWRIAR